MILSTIWIMQKKTMFFKTRTRKVFGISLLIALVAILTFSLVACSAKDIDMSSVELSDSTFVYDGTAKTLELKNLPSGVSYEFQIADANGNRVEASNVVNVGEYFFTAVFSVSNGKKFKTPESMAAKLTITKATYDMTGFSITGLEYNYDGTAKAPTLNGVPEGVQATVKLFSGDQEVEEAVNVGEYRVEVSFAVDGNHNAIESRSATLAISQGSYDMTNFVIGNLEHSYDGQAKVPTISGVPQGVQATVKLYKGEAEVQSAVDAGQYNVVVSFAVDANHEAIANRSASLTIGKASYDMSAFSITGLSPVYDGQAHAPQISGVPAGVQATVTIYSGDNKVDEAINAGLYRVEVAFSGDANHNAIEKRTEYLTVAKATYDMSGFSISGLEVTYDGAAHRPALVGVPAGVQAELKFFKGDVEIENATYAGEYRAEVTFTVDANHNAIAKVTENVTIAKLVKEIATYADLKAMAQEVQQNFNLFMPTKEVGVDELSWEDFDGGDPEARWSHNVVYKLVADIDCEGQTWKAVGWNVGHYMLTEQKDDAEGNEYYTVLGTDKVVVSPRADGPTLYGFGYVNFYLDGQGHKISNLYINNDTHEKTNGAYGSEPGQFPSFLSNVAGSNYKQEGMFISTSFTTFKNIVFENPVVEVEDLSTTVAWVGILNATEGYANTYEDLTFVNPTMKVTAPKINAGAIAGITLVLSPAREGAERGADMELSRAEDMITTFKNVEMTGVYFYGDGRGSRSSFGALYGESQSGWETFNLTNVDIDGTIIITNTAAASNNHAGEIFGYIDDKYLTNGNYTKDPNALYKFNLKDCDFDIEFGLAPSPMVPRA